MSVDILDATLGNFIGATSGPVPITAPAGSKIVVTIGLGGSVSSSVTDSASHFYTQMDMSSSSGGSISSTLMYWATVTTADPTLTITRSGSGALAYTILVVSESDVADYSTIGNGSGSVSVVLPTVSVPEDNSLAIGVCMAGGTAGMNAVTPDFVEVSHQDTAATRQTWVYARGVSAGPLDVVFDWAGGRSGAASVIVLASPSGPAGIPEILGVWNGGTVDPVELVGVKTESGVDVVVVIGQT